MKKIKLNGSIIFILFLILIYIGDYNYQRIKYRQIDTEISKMNKKTEKIKVLNLEKWDIQETFFTKLKEKKDFYYHLFGLEIFPKIIKVERKIYEIKKVVKISTEEFEATFSKNMENFYVKGLPYNYLNEETIFYKDDIYLENYLLKIVNGTFRDSFSRDYIFDLLDTSDSLSLEFPEKKITMYFKKNNGKWIVDSFYQNVLSSEKTFYRVGDKGEFIDYKKQITRKILYFNNETDQIKEECIYEKDKILEKKYNIFGDLISVKNIN